MGIFTSSPISSSTHKNKIDKKYSISPETEQETKYNLRHFIKLDETTKHIVEENQFYYVFVALFSYKDDKKKEAHNFNTLVLLNEAYKQNYTCFYMMDIERGDFISILASLFQNTSHHLIMYINTHTYMDLIKDKTHLYLINDETNTVSGELLNRILSNNKQKRCIFTALSDACFSGNLWRFKKYNRKMLKNCISISACKKSEHNGYGKEYDDEKYGFSYFCMSLYAFLRDKPNATHKEIYEELKKHLNVFDQTVKGYDTNGNLWDYPLFIPN